MRQPRLKCIETGKSTNLDLCHGSNTWKFEEAMNRLVQQEHPGSHVVPVRDCDHLRTFQDDPDCRRATLRDGSGESDGQSFNFELTLAGPTFELTLADAAITPTRSGRPTILEKTMKSPSGLFGFDYCLDIGGRFTAYTDAYVDVDWGMVAKALCMFNDYDGSYTPRVCRKINELLQQMGKVVADAIKDEKSAKLWRTNFAEWERWLELSPADRPNPIESCADFEDPEMAADFLACPPLSEEKCERLFAGTDAPTNAYEEYVANSDGNKCIILHEKGGTERRLMHRLQALTKCTWRYTVQQLSDYRDFSLISADEKLSSMEAPDIARFLMG